MDLHAYATAVDQDRVIFLQGEVNHEMIQAFRQQQRRILDRKAEGPIIINIGSNGGNTTSGWALINEIQALAMTHQVDMVASGTIRSMAVYVYLAIPVTQRSIFPFATIYCHHGRLNFEAKFSGMAESLDYRQAENHSIIADFKYEDRLLRKMLAKGTRLTPKQVKNLLDSPREMYATEAIKLGFASAILQ